MSLPAEIRIQIYKIGTPSTCIGIPYSKGQFSIRHHRFSLSRAFGHDVNSIPFPPHIKALLRVKKIRDDMLPHLHLAWVGDLALPMPSYWNNFTCWDRFRRSAIPAITHLTVGINRLYWNYSSGTQYRQQLMRLMRWMRWRSQQTSRFRWNLTHLTLIEEPGYWTSLSHLVPNAARRRQLVWLPGPAEIPKKSEAVVREFPMIKGLRELKLVLLEQPGPVFLDRLSKKCEAHGTSLTIPEIPLFP